jgi:hypothetical protein
MRTWGRLQQIAMVSLQQQTQQQHWFYYHYCNSQCCWWSLSGAATLEGVATRLQWSWNEDNGEAGNFYTVLVLRGTYFIVMLYLKLR